MTTDLTTRIAELAATIEAQLAADEGYLQSNQHHLWTGRPLRRVKAGRSLVAAILAEHHDFIPGDEYYSCSQAVDPYEKDPRERYPGSGCGNPERAGEPCDCGRDQRVARLLGIIASEWEDSPRRVARRATVTASPSTTAPSRRRVQAALRRAQKSGTEITVASIATAAGVDRTFLYRRPDLLAAIQASHGPTLSDDDTLGRKRSVNFSPNLETLTTEAAAAQDIPFGQYVRIAVTEKLARELGVSAEDLDGAKRPAPRRRNYKERTSSEGEGQCRT